MNNNPAVLIVDDDAAQRALLAIDLRRAGYPSLSAASGDEALEVLGSRPVSFMLTDGAMDGMDGFELSRRAKELKPGLRIAMLSAVYDERDAPEAPIERYFEKPAATSHIVGWLQGGR